MDFEKSATKKLEKELKKTSTVLEEERAAAGKHKQASDSTTFIFWLCIGEILFLSLNFNWIAVQTQQCKHDVCPANFLLTWMQCFWTNDVLCLYNLLSSAIMVRNVSILDHPENFEVYLPDVCGSVSENWLVLLTALKTRSRGNGSAVTGCAGFSNCVERHNNECLLTGGDHVDQGEEAFVWEAGGSAAGTIPGRDVTGFSHQ